ncbi:3-deoxy-7-phosphoheptulonate synthase [Moorena sp. SIOASIH]|uniref:3-deoxy-7-phosphoheptulonate synthase n=2 Tax=Moorena TaxID=1155738 RepID=UPI00344CFC5A
MEPPGGPQQYNLRSFVFLGKAATRARHDHLPLQLLQLLLFLAQKSFRVVMVVPTFHSNPEPSRNRVFFTSISVTKSLTKESITMLNAKLALATNPNHQTIVRLSEQVVFGGSELVIIGGPCTVESHAQMETVATKLKAAPVQALRGGAFKPRTSPYSFQGLGLAGLEILSDIRRRHQIPVVTEVMSIGQIESIATHADLLQVGSRNMQNFDLLKALGKQDLPILLKRGLAATVEEFVMAAEYILSHGNSQVVLCERGIRSFDNYTRNILDLGAVVALKQLTHLPVIVDPSHAVGKRELVAPLAKAAVAAGADGLIIECHPEPEKSVSDARQALSIEAMVDLVHSLKPVAAAVGRQIAEPVTLPELAIDLGQKATLRERSRYANAS